MSAPTTPVAVDLDSPPSAVAPEARRLRDLTPTQRKSGLAAWLGWMFDGLDIHIYTMVAAPFVAVLLHVASTSDPAVKEKSAWIQAAFLIGWAAGGAVFGRLGDLLGRSRSLSLTILTYAVFTGLSFFATEWWHLLICRFLAALGIGGEWAVGSALLSETWPKAWRAWVSAVLQTGVNVGIMVATAAVWVMSHPTTYELLSSVIKDLPPNFYLRSVFLIGVLPAGLVFWIRRHVPEPAEWVAAQAVAGGEAKPGILDLFRGDVRRTTLMTIGVCATSLTAWWAFMFWSTDYLGELAKAAGKSASEVSQFKATSFSWIIGVSVFGNFFAAALARRIGYRNAIAVMCLMFTATMVAAFYTKRSPEELRLWLPAVGFCSGVLGLFTMYLPPLFPTLLRTTGAGFCFNIGRLVAAAGTIVFVPLMQQTDQRVALLWTALLFVPAALTALRMPDLRDV